MTSILKSRSWYGEAAIVKKQTRFVEAVGPCVKANGHCIHESHNRYSATSSSREQWVGDNAWCCLCPAKAKFGRLENNFGPVKR